MRLSRDGGHRKARGSDSPQGVCSLLLTARGKRICRPPSDLLARTGRGQALCAAVLVGALCMLSTSSMPCFGEECRAHFSLCPAGAAVRVDPHPAWQGHRGPCDHGSTAGRTRTIPTVAFTVSHRLLRTGNSRGSIRVKPQKQGRSQQNTAGLAILQRARCGKRWTALDHVRQSVSSSGSVNCDVHACDVNFWLENLVQNDTVSTCTCCLALGSCCSNQLAFDNIRSCTTCFCMYPSGP